MSMVNEVEAYCLFQGAGGSGGAGGCTKQWLDDNDGGSVCKN